MLKLIAILALLSMPPRPLDGCGGGNPYSPLPQSPLPYCSTCEWGTPPALCTNTCATAYRMDQRAAAQTASEQWRANCNAYQAGAAACDPGSSGYQACLDSATGAWEGENTKIYEQFSTAMDDAEQAYCSCLSACCPQ